MAPRIRLYGLRHLRSPAAADDLVQQVLLETLETVRAGRLRESDRLAHFVLGTCRVTVMDARRSSRRHADLLEQFGTMLVPDEPRIPEMDGDRLGRCVQALNERARSVVVMTFYDEHSAADTSRSLGLSEANIRVIRHRAIKQLRVCMGADS
jgi:RNA polymerase sigma-70 factor (ECF subfamily)